MSNNAPIRRVDYLTQKAPVRDYYTREWQPANYAPGRVRAITGDDLMDIYAKANIRAYNDQSDSLNDIDRQVLKEVPLWRTEPGINEWMTKYDPLRRQRLRDIEENVSFGLERVDNI